MRILSRMSLARCEYEFLQLQVVLLTGTLYRLAACFQNGTAVGRFPQSRLVVMLLESASRCRGWPWPSGLRHPGRASPAAAKNRGLVSAHELAHVRWSFIAYEYERLT